MIKALQSELRINVIASIIVSVLFSRRSVFFGENTRSDGASLGEISKSTISIRSPSLGRTLASSA